MRWLALALFGPLCFGQTGMPVADLEALDSIMQTALTRYEIQGGALAVVKDGRLVFARGYGLADAEAGQPVEPDASFRWCSMSKTLATAALLRLVDQGSVDLDAPIFTILDNFAPYNGAWGDEYLRAITVRQGLHQTAGWDRSAGPTHDPVVGEGTVLVPDATGAAFPPTLDAVIRYALAQPLDFAPGACCAYSNFGYERTGRVVEKASGRSYADHIRESVLDPFGLPGVRQASAHRSGRMPGEVVYYDFPGAPPVRSYVSPGRELVPAPYGLLVPELGDSAGAWVGSAIDLAKFMSMLDGSRPPAILTRDRFGAMLEQSQPPTWIDEPSGPALAWHHGGSNPGSRGFFCRFPNGGGFACLFNGDTADRASLANSVTQALVETLSALRSWPTGDLFPRYYPPRISTGGVDSGSVVRLRDSSGVEHALDILYSGLHQINARVPALAAPGPAALAVSRAGWPHSVGEITLARRAPE